jgi:hypothetical protein
MSNETSVSQLFIAIAKDLRTNRAVRRTRNQLRADLARYDSPADRRELDAILNRHPAEQAAEIRSLLANDSSGQRRP